MSKKRLCRPQSVFFPLFKARPQFLTMSILTLKPKILRINKFKRAIHSTLSFKQNKKEHTTKDYYLQRQRRALQYATISYYPSKVAKEWRNIPL